MITRKSKVSKIAIELDENFSKTEKKFSASKGKCIFIKFSFDV